ncbi:MAG: hypothetical protein K6E97_01275 [Treponema sp.]|jgi:hypothetical protein|nr:hypothetical protein [Treponema sp.]
MAIAALVLGILSLVSFWTGYGGFGLGILAIIFGALGLKKGGPDAGKAKAGLIMGIIACAGGIIVLVACVGCAACVSQSAGGLQNLFNL